MIWPKKISKSGCMTQGITQKAVWSPMEGSKHFLSIEEFLLQIQEELKKLPLESILLIF